MFLLVGRLRISSIVVGQAGPGEGELTIAAPQVLFETPGVIRDYDVTQDGERFLFVMSPTEQLYEPLTLVVNWTAELHR